jgi:hypothetical protein
VERGLQLAFEISKDIYERVAILVFADLPSILISKVLVAKKIPPD